MALVCTETKPKKPNKLGDKVPYDFKYIGNGTQDQRNSIEEKPEHELIKENLYEMEIVWPSVIAFLIMHLGALYSIYLCFFRTKFLTAFYGLFMINLTGMSITMGAHRLYSHRTFKANTYIRCILVIVHASAGQKTLWTWVRDHRTHHKYSDTNADPHNSNRGFFFSHIGWLLVRRHPDVIKKGKTIDMSDVEQDSIAMFQKNHYLKLFFIFGIVLPTCIPCLLWKETIWNSFFISFVFRVTGCWNITWLINSATHMFGSRPYTKDMAPAENPFVSFICLGEGMHNYHHTFPWDYRASEYINITTMLIDYCVKRGWIYDVKTASPELLKRQTMKNGDGSHPVYNTLNPNGVADSEQSWIKNFNKNE